ncbi:hypothetical protein L873DRAFT_1799238 [Choiromyces venosus 120613-1]|uniref:Uncharacterized protein n=1 Tax=Choiromyces venosus 120613-1 TaxID=1336337 RepID=A0A3N4K4W4_9PEZI|nr:hypothetical protein L873DRAFT_1799238 [Choiromyces venosus 120613-1]
MTTQTDLQSPRQKPNNRVTTHVSATHSIHSFIHPSPPFPINQSLRPSPPEGEVLG